VSIIERALQKSSNAPEAESRGTKGATETVRPRGIDQQDITLGRHSRPPDLLVERPDLDLPPELLRDCGLLATPHYEETVRKEFRRIKRPVLMNAFGQGGVPVERGNLVMVTSAMPSEGKTFTAFNLAMSIARELDYTVLIVDCDVVNPSLTRKLGMEDRRGMIDELVEQRLNIGKLFVSTSIAKLRFMPAGQLTEHSDELLASKSMEALANELAARYSDRIIIFDAPPMLVTTQAAVLSRLMGQILFVIEEGKTPQQAVIDAVAHFRESQAVGLVVNKSHHRARGGYYGPYSYGYGYG
jgi:protein-tyrosine kinase